jgi:hypothetical protein
MQDAERVGNLPLLRREIGPIDALSAHVASSPAVPFWLRPVIHILAASPMTKLSYGSLLSLSLLSFPWPIAPPVAGASGR